VTLSLFALVVAFASRQGGRHGALAAGLATCLAADVLLAPVDPPAWVGLIAAVGASAASGRILSRITTRTTSEVVAAPGPSAPVWDLPARAVATAALVLAVTGAAQAVGPGASGVLAPFPVASTVVTAFTLHQQGAQATVDLLAGPCRGLIGFSVFCFLVAVLLVPLGGAATFSLATAASVTTQVMLARLGA
jgi:hypothetical protein